MKRWSIAAALVAAALACGQPPPGSVSPRDRDVLTRDEIWSNSKDGLDLYEALQSLRPHFIEAPLGIQRGSAPRGLTVYIDSREAGGIEVLRGLSAGNVDEVRYLGPTESQSEYGQRATLVTLKITLHHASRDTTFDAGGRVNRWSGGQAAAIHLSTPPPVRP
jgi:hypothetical protein